MEEAELLLAVGGVVGGVHVQDDDFPGAGMGLEIHSSSQSETFAIQWRLAMKRISQAVKYVFIINIILLMCAGTGQAAYKWVNFTVIRTGHMLTNPPDETNYIDFIYLQCSKEQPRYYILTSNPKEMLAIAITAQVLNKNVLGLVETEVQGGETPLNAIPLYGITLK